jgi:dephospho-CoA kinase
LNRKYVADKIFTDKTLLNSVNAIIHPKVAAHFKKWALDQIANYVIKEAAILFENGGYKECDVIILVTAPKALRMQRVIKRDNATRDEIEQRMENQWSDSKKKKLANIIIENIEIGATRQQVQLIHKSLK